MSGCNATIQVGGETLACDLPRDKHSPFASAAKHGSQRGFIDWWDDAPGATPHKEPTPNYWVHENYKGQWFVIRGTGIAEGDHVVCFEPSHPDPQSAAEAHAEYLKGEGGPELAARVVLQRMHNAEAERDQYRKALAKIAATYPSQAVVPARLYACRVLDGGQP